MDSFSIFWCNWFWWIYKSEACENKKQADMVKEVAKGPYEYYNNNRGSIQVKNWNSNGGKRKTRRKGKRQTKTKTKTKKKCVL